MTQAEYLELLVMFTDSTISNLMSYVTIYFAFLAAIFFVGRQLKTSYFWSLVALYSLFASVMISITLRSYARLIELALDFLSVFPDEASKYLTPSSNPLLSPAGMPVILVATWVASITFAVFLRRGATYQDDT